MAASQEGHDKLVVLLLGAGANIGLMKKDGCSALFCASQKGYVKIVKMLLEQNAPVDLKLSNGDTALSAAAYHGHISIAHMFITSGACVNNARHSDGVTPLMLASGMEKDEIVTLLILYGANIEAVTTNRQSSLLIACYGGHVSIAQLLLKEGANPHVCDQNGSSPFQIANEKKYRELVSIMSNPPIKKLQSMSLEPGTSVSNKKTNSTESGESDGTSNLECVVCMDPRTTTVMTLPCRHAVTCQRCIDDIESRGDNRCPLCRTEIDQRISIFIN
ncbi:unnamed protein product [Meganyctiphanes norvegica]|uniref:RING-type domain-containing protein n=1 Tax=Meganyctiphanes norvegica TaxID=48144 RepID=A0AAV2S742_MEGNR